MSYDVLVDGDSQGQINNIVIYKIPNDYDCYADAYDDGVAQVALQVILDYDQSEELYFYHTTISDHTAIRQGGTNVSVGVVPIFLSSLTDEQKNAYGSILDQTQTSPTQWILFRNPDGTAVMMSESGREVILDNE